MRQSSYIERRAIMRTKSTEKANAIIEFIDSFFERNRRSPSIREIEAGTGKRQGAVALRNSPHQKK